ncbi:exopolysaccharide biosynthesis polyprenyl glycosylphosphotransferase [Winogradskyella psychrotolerans]|uniref:exopolysaccharide biosynthesis polyprenyl glycosylphosphotransferase n=1 Tax=Winogradskyella psychrotolerans TaxID=1344585 RepID=UPI001C07CB78|nr:exopolysaccharide biosynthesis polyprenyl glycosylphosphotransferase [Winogradskyella psychrotolerans]MBU2926789.1 exopolysaccharide biosynthesis polyprenyl glycosylphosphotransferase [Winogradskyella psychrotolerans]
MNDRFYTQLLRPVLYIIDLLLVCLLLVKLLAVDINIIIAPILFWTILSLFSPLKNGNKTLRIIRIICVTLIVRVSLFLLLILSYFYIIDYKIGVFKIVNFYFSLFFVLSLWRILAFILIKRYLRYKGIYYNNVIIIGHNDSTKKLEYFFEHNKDHNYKYKGFFTNKETKKKLGNISESFNYIKENKIDEIYCSVKELSDEQMTELVYFADNNLKTLKLIPNNKYVFSKKLKFENHDLIPIFSLSNIPLKDNLNIIIKRTFDIAFSLLVIIGFLSWFTPLIALLILFESRGDVFFRQLRYGADFKLFACYKFRSMSANKESDSLQASKNDMRITRVGKFIRKTSIDELPQFYNVLFGSMSVVGPRPLLLSHTNDYKNKINKFMVRHTVKPGITGLAQVSGYRGNIEKDSDMHNRVKYDIFYIENWSMFLDLKIIIKTVLNVIKGEEKAY